jgi:multidrug efflux system membrane fusion protein
MDHPDDALSSKHDPGLHAKRRGIRTLTLVLVGCAVVAGGAAHFFLSSKAVTTKQTAAAPIPVVTAIVQQQDVPIILTGLGIVQGLNTATIHTQVTGILERVDFTEGQFVKQGDVLANIDPRTFQALLDQAKAQLMRDQTQLTNLQTNLNRIEPLLKEGFATDLQATDQRSKIGQLESTIRSDEEAVNAAQIQLDFTALKAPFDGVTGLRLIDIGNVVHPTDPTGVVVLTQVQPISVIFTLPAKDISAVQGALSKGPVQAIVYDQADKTMLDKGTLLVVSNQADQNSGTVQLKATFPNKDKQLWPGTFVNARVVTSVVKDALTIPTDAIQQNDTGQFVYVVETGNKVSVRPIEVVQRVSGEAVIGKGLKTGETVVVQGQYRLVPGTLVVPAAPAAVSNSSTASSGMLP